MNSLWQEDSPMPDRPLTVHCSRLGGGLLSPDHVRCSDRNKDIAEKRILIATGGSATAEMAMKYSSFSL